MSNLEKIYRDKLQNIEMQTSDKVWENVSQALIRKRRIKRFFIYFFTAAGIALIIGTVLYLSKTHSGTDKQINQNNKEIAKVSNSNVDNPVKTNNFIDKNKKSPNQNTEIVEKNISNPITKNYNNIKSYTYNGVNRYRKPALKDLEFIVENNDSQSTTNHSIAYNLQQSKEIDIQKLDILNFDSKLNYSNSGIRLFNFKIKPSGILNDCFPDKTDKWFMDIYLSPDYAKKNLTGPKQDYIDSRISSESALLSYSGGIMAGYKFNKNIFIKGGVNFTSINEKFHIVIKDVINTQTVITIDTVWNSNGSYYITRDTTIKEIYGKEDIQKLNTYSMIDIPLILGYQFKYNDLNVGINTGMILNLLSFQKATMLNMNGEVESFDQNSSYNIFNKNLGVSIYTSAYLGYRINENVELFVEPKFRYYLKSFTNANYPLTQKYSKFGISLGPRYFFN